MLRAILFSILAFTAPAFAQEKDSCDSLSHIKILGVEITRTAHVEAGTTELIPWNQTRSAPLPAYCRVEGVMNRRTGVADEEFGITFALAMPDKWNGDFLMQGGGGSNGIVLPPLGLNAAGDNPGLMRGFAVVSTDTGHKSRHPGFDFSFTRDQEAYLDFAYLANAEVAALAKQLIAQHYGKPAAFSYFSGCSTGGREGMILSQRYPTVFNGIISGDPAMRTGLSNLAIGRWIPGSGKSRRHQESPRRPEDLHWNTGLRWFPLRHRHYKRPTVQGIALTGIRYFRARHNRHFNGC
ncbi:MAG TPA: DUF6351 family protein [Candidatus Sulfotelmatobacter sp.]|nr:DUF6351 family protein [Candidatus Sulfotelmatobacter sp.]